MSDSVRHLPGADSELMRLVNAACEGTATLEDGRRLEALLATASNRGFYLAATEVHASLSWRWQPGDGLPQTACQGGPRPLPADGQPPASSAARAAIVAVLAVLRGWLRQLGQAGPLAGLVELAAVDASRPAPEPPLRLAAGASAGVDEAGRLVQRPANLARGFVRAMPSQPGRPQTIFERIGWDDSAAETIYRDKFQAAGSLAGSTNVFNTGTGRTGTINLQAGSLALNNLTLSTGTAAFDFSGGTLRPYSTDATIGSGTSGANFSIGLTGTAATISGVDFDPVTPVPRSLDLYATLADGGSAGGVTFSGGTVTVRAANTYTGSTAIAAKTTVALLGSAANSSGFAVNGTLDVSGQTSGFAFGAGQTLSGAGTIDLPATGPGVSLAGFLAPGNVALGTLAIGAELLGFADFDLTTLAGFGPGTYALFPASTLSGSLGAATTGSLGGFDATLEQSGGTIQLVVVPEPGSLLLAAMVLAAAWATGRRGGMASGS